jgi:hypothetical protein
MADERPKHGGRVALEWRSRRPKRLPARLLSPCEHSFRRERLEQGRSRYVGRSPLLTIPSGR